MTEGDGLTQFFVGLDLTYLVRFVILGLLFFGQFNRGVGAAFGAVQHGFAFAARLEGHVDGIGENETLLRRRLVSPYLRHTYMPNLKCQCIAFEMWVNDGARLDSNALASLSILTVENDGAGE